MLDLSYLRDYDLCSTESGINALLYCGQVIAFLGSVQLLLEKGLMTADRGGENAKGYVFLMLCETRSSKIYPDFDSCLFSCAEQHHAGVSS